VFLLFSHLAARACAADHTVLHACTQAEVLRVPTRLPLLELFKNVNTPSPEPGFPVRRINEANSPECRQLIAEFVNSEFEEMRAIFYRCLRSIEHAMSARREYMTKEGQIVYGGPDHYARLTATKHFRDFLTAGRPAPKQPEKQERRGMTLQELQELVASSEQSRSGVDVAA
jgi:hypothetical protein